MGLHPRPTPQAHADALTAAGCERIFLDTASGKLARRPELDAALRGLWAGDQLVVTKLGRLGRSLEHLIALSHQLQADRVDMGAVSVTARSPRWRPGA